MRKFKNASDIKVGVVGYGGAFNMGKSHLDEMRKAGMTPLAVAEIDPERLKTAEKDFPGIETYSSVKDMLAKSAVDMLAIITPHNSHAKIAIDCLRAGRAVVCEKPFAITTPECDAMIREARKGGIVLSTYHNRHWDGCVMQALKAVRSGAIGDVFRVEAHMGGWGCPSDWWRSSRSISGGILYDWGVHLLEYSLQILHPSRIGEISGFAKTGFWADKTKWKKDTNEDEGFCTVRFDDGRWLTLCISSLDSKPKEGWLEITGTKGSYVMEGGSWKMITHKDDGVTVTETGKNPANEGWRLYQNIADHLVKGEKLVITPEWARRPIHIIELACLSAKKGQTLKAKYA
jgi:predicted dehydrogenase